MTLESSISLTANWIAFLLYGLGTLGLCLSFIRQNAVNSNYLFALTAVTLLFHALSIHGMNFTPEGFYLTFYGSASIIFWVINLVVFLSSVKKPVHNLFLLLYPLSALCLGASLLAHESTSNRLLDYSLASHVILSILAYSLLMIASLQALLLAYQNRRLRQKQLSSKNTFLPPLMTMEALLFEFIWVGEILLTLSIVSGFWFLDDMFAQHLAHKTIFSIAAWFIYAALLIGRWKQGWRGYKAIRWALVGFLCLMLAYFGSRLVLEFLLR